MIDRSFKDGVNVVKDVFEVYGPKYNIIVFPPKNDDPECRIQVVFYKYNLVRELEDLFSISIDYDFDDPPEFFDFDLTEIEEEVFIEILEKRFGISITNLSETKDFMQFIKEDQY